MENKIVIRFAMTKGEGEYPAGCVHQGAEERGLRNLADVELARKAFRVRTYVYGRSYFRGEGR